MWSIALTLIKIYKEKEQAEQIKIQTYRLRKGAPGSGIELNTVFKEINKLRNGIRSGYLRERFYPTKFPTCKKELKV